MEKKNGNKYVLVLDEGTSSTRAIIFDDQFRVVSRSSQELQVFTRDHKVEQDGEEILQKSIDVCRDAIRKSGVDRSRIECMGITNQRTTCLPWDRKTGKPLYRAINWADSRTGDIFEKIRKDGWLDKLSSMMMINQCVPLLNLYWLLHNVEAVWEKAAANELMFGSMDTWLIYHLTKTNRYVLSYSNLSMFTGFDFIRKKWNREYLGYLGISEELLPEIVDDCGVIGETDEKFFDISIPIASDIADQQSATFAHRVLDKGMVKCTCGTGAFIDINVGNTFLPAPEGMFSISTCKLREKYYYQIEGVVIAAGGVIRWLRDGLNLIDDFGEINHLVHSVDDAGDLYFIPTLNGLGSPYWDFNTLGTLVGISTSTRRGHIVRAAFEGIIFRIREICDIVVRECGIDIEEISIDGGVSRDDFMCQLLADYSHIRIKRPNLVEITSLGAAEMAGLAVGMWDESQFDNVIRDYTIFYPDKKEIGKIEEKYFHWKEILDLSRKIYKEEGQ